MYQLHIENNNDEEKSSSNLSPKNIGYNLIKSVIGIGLLSISYTLKQCGWSFLIILCFTSVITLYNAINIGNLVQKYSKEVNYIINYSTLGYFTYGKYFSIFISMCCTIEIYMVSLVVVNLATNFILQLSFISDNYKIYIEIFIILCYLSVSFFRKYENIAILSCCGIATNILLIICLIIKLCITKNIIIDNKIIEITNIPGCIGISLFSFGGHVVFPEIFDTIKNKNKLSKTILLSWIPITLFTLSFAILGFILFGNNTLDNIMSDMENGYVKNTLIILLFFNLVFSFPLLVNPILIKIKYINCILTRFLYMISLFLICHYWKSFIQMMSLTGVILENITSLILPPILILKADNTLNIYHKILNILIIIFGLSIMISGIILEI
jgi:solute carrier family 32 (vesicular inhibitory amino acid transporter)